MLSPPAAGRYVFRVFALDRVLGVADKVWADGLETSLEKRILNRAELVGGHKDG